MLSWSEIRTNAARFAQEWADVEKENAEAQSFWNEFLRAYGIDRRRVASFEAKVQGLKKGSGRGRIDLLWRGVFMAEHKSRGEDLDAALQQALAYLEVLEEHEKPKFIAVSDFAHIHLYEVETEELKVTAVKDLPRYVEAFSFIIGKQLRHAEQTDPVNVKAASEMGRLHNMLADSGYTGHHLEVLLVRLLFLLFGDNTGLWDAKNLFFDLLLDETRSDGRDVGTQLASLFQVLDTPIQQRPSTLPDYLKAFPYVNGELFSERIDLAYFNPEMRELLIEASKVNWSQVSPAIFGSMFQSVMDADARRHLGAHYTSEDNILKALGPLFLDDLRDELKSAGNSKRKLQAFLDKLPRIRIFDPACGSGNFLILAYRELRRLELEALSRLLVDTSGAIQGVVDIELRLKVNVGQFYGIEYDEFPSQIARVAMWLTDHQMNIEASYKLGQHFIRLPLTNAAHILHGDALEADWAEWLGLDTEAGTQDLEALYIVGNPPFVGGKKMSKKQRAQVKQLFEGVKDNGILDYVSAWYLKAAQLLYRLNTTFPTLKTGAALVSTNSITQGEQVAPLWGTVLNDYGMGLTFAHQTFKWSNDAPNNAGVYCVIVGFAPKAEAEKTSKRLYTYENEKGTALERAVKQLNPYLLPSPEILVYKSRTPIQTGVPPIHFGNMPLDGGHLLLTEEEKDELLKAEPAATPFVKPLLDARSFLNGGMRYCLWLEDASPAQLAALPLVRERVRQVKEWRLASVAPSTRKFAETPTLFRDRRKAERYLAVPKVSSSKREYIPIGYLTSETVVNDLLFMVPDADLFHYGVMQSRLHMDWMRLVSGRLGNGYRYSKDLSYNTFPWPDRAALKPKQVQAVEAAAQAVLDAREKYPDSTLAELYDPLLMPRELRAAHTALDKAVDALYGLKAGATEAERLARLLELYQELAPTLTGSKKQKGKRKKKSTP